MVDWFTIEKVSDSITRITDITGVSMFLAEGTDGAVLIDTGCGIGDLKKVVDSLTTKPVKVLLTHGHVDHALGAALFDEIYMSSLDNDILKSSSETSVRLGFASPIVKTMGIELTENLLVPEPDTKKIKELKDNIEAYKN